jgi:hypothetical protein
VRLISRGGHDWAKHFPLIVEAALKLCQKHFVIDGEVVVPDKRRYLRLRRAGLAQARQAGAVICLPYTPGEPLLRWAIASSAGRRQPPTSELATGAFTEGIDLTVPSGYRVLLWGVIMAWQSRPVFISSTFANMQAERDYFCSHSSFVMGLSEM